MAEYIEREAALKRIDTAISEFARHGEIVSFIADCRASVIYAPAADVVEVVRCKDCKRCYEKRTKRNKQLMRFCMRMDGREYQVNANDFCSYGKRRVSEQ